MLRNVLLAVGAAALTTLMTPGGASAWGARHVGYTHVGPAGVQHVGRTAVAGPYGYRVGGSGYSSSFGGAAGYRYGGAGAYGYHGASYAGGYRYATPYGTYGAGAYRRW